jgi:hypothetical protein
MDTVIVVGRKGNPELSLGAHAFLAVDHFYVISLKVQFKSLIIFICSQKLDLPSLAADSAVLDYQI